MVIVEADGRVDAAQAGGEALDAELRGPPHEVEIDKVQVFPIADSPPPEWFSISWRAQAVIVPESFQCCGGAPTLDGHSGYCPNRAPTD